MSLVAEGQVRRATRQCLVAEGQVRRATRQCLWWRKDKYDEPHGSVSGGGRTSTTSHTAVSLVAEGQVDCNDRRGSKDMEFRRKRSLYGQAVVFMKCDQ